MIPGADFGVIVEAADSAGSPDVSQNGTVELSGTDGSSYYSTMIAGEAVFNDISLASLGSYDYTASLESSSLTPGTSTSCDRGHADAGGQLLLPDADLRHSRRPGRPVQCRQCRELGRRHQYHRAVAVNHSLRRFAR